MVREKAPGETEGLVFGTGPAHARVMLIGEAPGATEVAEKRPFAGKAGRNLDHFLEVCGIAREQLYITNTVKYRPRKTGPSGRVSNRPPTRQEVEMMRPFLLEEIRLIAPGIIATLGNTPLHALAGYAVTVGTVHGTILRPVDCGVPVYALFHPASLIYNPSLAEVYEQDLRGLAKMIAEGRSFI